MNQNVITQRHTYPFIIKSDVNEENDKNEFLNISISQCKQYVALTDIFSVSFMKISDFLQEIKHCNKDKRTFNLLTYPHITLTIEDMWCLNVVFNNNEITFCDTSGLYYYQLPQTLDNLFSLLNNHTKPNVSKDGYDFSIHNYTVMENLFENIDSKITLCKPNNIQGHVFVNWFEKTKCSFKKITQNANDDFCYLIHKHNKNYFYTTEIYKDLIINEVEDVFDETSYQVYEVIDMKQLKWIKSCNIFEYKYQHFNQFKKSKYFSLSINNWKENKENKLNRHYSYNHNFQQQLTCYNEFTLDNQTTIIFTIVEIKENEKIPEFLNDVVNEQKEIMDNIISERGYAAIAVFEIVKTKSEN